MYTLWEKKEKEGEKEFQVKKKKEVSYVLSKTM